MDEFKIIRQTGTSIEIEATASGDRYSFAVMPLGDSDRTLVLTVEVQGHGSASQDMGEVYGGARAFADKVMREAGAIG